jgi:hypothetical protein
MSELPKTYRKGTLLAVASGICGYDIQIVNEGYTNFKFTVLRDSAVALGVSSSVLLFSMIN